MPGVDWPVERLKRYQGSFPAPEDFGLFWKKKKQEIEKIKPDICQERVIFPGEKLRYYRISVKAVDGCVLRAKYICPDTEKRFPTEVVFHDYPQASRGWFYLGRYAAIGRGVLAPDCRGQGGESDSGFCGKGPTAYGPMFNGLEDVVDNMYLCRLIEDAFLWITVAEALPYVDKEELTVYGEGQGGGLAVACAALYPEIRKCGAHYPMLCDYKRVWEIDFDEGAYEGLRYFFCWRDPLHEREEELFKKLSYVDVKNFAPMVKAKTLMSTGLLDRVSPPSAQFSVFNGLQCEKQHLIYPKHGHERNNFFENEHLKFLLEG